jgi:hypothetical protein
MVDEPRMKVRVAPKLVDQNAKIAALVKMITKYGPQINRISRDLGVHKETARYWYKEKLLKKGYTVQAIANHERLGLSRVVALVEFSEVFKPYADAILMAMSELCYLSSFIKTLPEDMYSIQAAVPKEHTGAWVDFMLTLKQKGLFSSVQAVPFEWVRVVPMRAEMYDFEGDSWQYDWASKPRAAYDPNEFLPSATGKFDSTDLSIIKQMQVDPDASLTETQSRLKINYKTLTWHYRRHIVGNGLLKGYYVNWAGTRYDPKLEKALHRRHRYMWFELLVRDVNETERMSLMANVSRLPFVWLEAGGSSYFAQIAFPMESLTEALGFIKETVAPVRDRASWHFFDQTDALRFTIVPELYDSVSKKWTFNQMEALNRFDKLILEIKGKTS